MTTPRGTPPIMHTTTNAMAHDVRDPHATVPPLLAGAPLDGASYAVIVVHGRGGTPESMLPLLKAAGAFDAGSMAAVIAPRAADLSWYPDRFLAPVEQNEPWLSSALQSVGAAVQRAEAAGIARDRIVIAGFSQGACLALEFVARHPARYGGVAALAGALVGAEPRTSPLDRALRGTPVLLACGDADAHIPEARVRSAADAFIHAGATVDLRVYPGLGHTVVGDQVDALRSMLEQVRRSALV